MPSDRSVYQIEVQYKAELTQLNAQTASLQAHREALKAQGKDYDDIDQKIILNQKRQEELKHALDGVEKEAEKSTGKMIDGADHAQLSHRELHHILHAVGSEFGGIGELALVSYGGILAATGAMLTSFELIKGKCEEATEYLTRMNEAAINIDTSKFDALAKSASDARTAISDLAREQDKLDADYARGDAALENRIKQYAREKDAIMKVVEAQEKEQEQQIDLKVERGEMTKEQGETAKENARLDLDRFRGQGNLDKLMEEIQVRKEQYDAAIDRLFNGAKDGVAIQKALAAEAKPSADAEVARKKVEIAKASPIAVQGVKDWTGDIVNAKNRDDLVNKLAEAQALVEQNKVSKAEAEKTPGHEGNAYHYQHNIEMYSAYAKAYSEALDKQDAYVRNLQSELAVKEDAVKQSKAVTQAAKDQYAHDNELNRSGPDRIKALLDQLHTEESAEKKIEELNAKASSEATQTRRLAHLKKIQEDQRAGRELSPDDAAELHGLQTAMRNRSATSEQRQLAEGLQSSETAPANRAAQAQWSNTPRDQVPDLGMGKLALAEMTAKIKLHEATIEQYDALLNQFIGLAHDIQNTNARGFQTLASQLARLRSSIAAHGASIDNLQSQGDVMRDNQH